MNAAPETPQLRAGAPGDFPRVDTNGQDPDAHEDDADNADRRPKSWEGFGTTALGAWLKQLLKDSPLLGEDVGGVTTSTAANV